MSEILLFKYPKVEAPALDVDESGFDHLDAWGLEELRRGRRRLQALTTGVRERVAILAYVFGMTELVKMSDDEAGFALMKLSCGRADVCSVLGAYWRRNPGMTALALWSSI